jgi:hypothetical protein
MGLLDDLNDRSKVERVEKMKCTMCVILTKVTADEKKKLVELLSDEAVSKANLSRVLTANGYKVSQGTISRHVRNECRGFSG